MGVFKELKKGALISLWFVFLTFPVMVIKVDPIARTVAWRWGNALYMGVGTFVVYFLVQFFMKKKAKKSRAPNVSTASNNSNASVSHQTSYRIHSMPNSLSSYPP